VKKKKLRLGSAGRGGRSPKKTKSGARGGIVQVEKTKGKRPGKRGNEAVKDSFRDVHPGQAAATIERKKRGAKKNQNVETRKIDAEPMGKETGRNEKTPNEGVVGVARRKGRQPTRTPITRRSKKKGKPPGAKDSAVSRPRGGSGQENLGYEGGTTNGEIRTERKEKDGGGAPLRECFRALTRPVEGAIGRWMRDPPHVGEK